MDFSYLLEPYEKLVATADNAFQRVKSEYPECVTCGSHCSDCCHAVFGLFPIEAYFLKNDFDRLDHVVKDAALKQADAADRALTKLEQTLKSFSGDPHMQDYAMAKARVRCPLLSDTEECILYAYRPITCRVYGVPTMIRGKPRVCSKSGFKKDQNYPVFNISAIHRELHQLSKDLLERAGQENFEKAGLLFSVSKIIKTPFEELVNLK